MPFNIYAGWRLRAALLAALLLRGTVALAQGCPPPSGDASAAGWRAYRADSLDAARALFERARLLCGRNADAASGLGYVALRRQDAPAADSLFRLVIRLDSLNADGWDGLSRSAYRLGDTTTAASAARRALTLDPGNGDARALLERLDPDWDRKPEAPAARPAALVLPARVRGERFEVPVGRAWRPFYIKGVNLGAALPGHHPSEFPADSAVYAGWLDTIATLHANTIRVYTILPPGFYRALRGWNRTHPAAALWLVHGVWTELPPGNDFDDQDWKSGFQREMERVVDLVHGRARLSPRPGHASGRYDADVSPWTLGFIIGREWEPYAVKAYDETHQRERTFAGRYLELAAGTPMDAWLAAQCDHMLAYEADRYNTLRPIAYTNWPTLDPLTHPSEATAAEEVEWRRRSGRMGNATAHEYENDAVAVDAMLVRPTAANPAGWFASYHAYPYYPDFMLHDPAYQTARSSEGRSNYFGYLRELQRHHAGIPLVIAEYGVPSSRGVAHLQPQGWNHGGHDERAMAAIDARLTREIREAGAAGGILFSWMDEWFKRNWLVIDFEIPLENTRQWSNVMDAEQHYGLLGHYAGRAGATPEPGGATARWLALPVIGRGTGTLKALRAGSDPAYVYLAVEMPEPDWAREGLEIGIDTWLRDRGQHRLPASGTTGDVGFEFAVELAGRDSGAVRVAPEYNRYALIADLASGEDYGHFYRRPVTVTDRRDGRFDPMFVVTNRSRYGRDGTFFPASGVDRGRLRFGAESASTLSDWYYDSTAGLLELRLPWDLLNVTDPSTRTLLFDRTGDGPFGTVTADSFHFTVVRYGKGSHAVTGAVTAAPWSWSGWTSPVSHARLKPAADSMRAAWSALP
ncbi:MAG: hypothetical protein ACM3OH_12365 [Bacillota bacterium]